MKTLPLIFVFLIACGSNHVVEIHTPDAVLGKLQVISLVNHEVVTEKIIEGDKAQFSYAELGLGTQPVEIKITTQDGFFSALVPSDYRSSTININSLTTLAVCRFSKTADLEKENQLIAQQFLIPDLQSIKPNMNFSSIQDFNYATSYGILLGGFSKLAKNQQLKTEKLLSLLCSDVSFDGVFNGVDQDGIIQSKYSKYDEQVLKAQYAQAIYQFSEASLPNFTKLPIEAYANEISLSHISVLFSPSIVNYSFDH